jgi:hypothetical protein
MIKDKLIIVFDIFLNQMETNVSLQKRIKQTFYALEFPLENNAAIPPKRVTPANKATTATPKLIKTNFPPCIKNKTPIPKEPKISKALNT